MDNRINNIEQYAYDDNLDFTPISRGRANTWPANRNDIHDVQPPNYNPVLSTFEEGASTHSSFSQLPTGDHPALIEQDESSDPQDDLSPQSAIKKTNSSRRNAWGNHSYADLITQGLKVFFNFCLQEILISFSLQPFNNLQNNV